MKKILVTILTELEYLRKVQSAIIASEKLGGNLAKEEWSKGCATGLLMAQNVIRNALEEAQKQSAPPPNNERDEICPKCQNKVDAIRWICVPCDKSYEYGRFGNPGKLSPVS